MTSVMFDEQHGASICFGDEALTAQASTMPDALLVKPSSRGQLVCQWMQTAEGLLTCMWTEAPSALLGAHDVWLPCPTHEDDFAWPTLPESRLQMVSRWIAVTVLLASTALGTLMCFVTEHSELL